MALETESRAEKKTALYEEHVSAGARIVPFGGFLMPIQYRGIIEEHRAVREAMGMFDLSHMGEFHVTGPGAVEAIDRLMTNDIAGLEVGQIRYTPMTYPHGGIVDDLLVYRFPHGLELVVNAANIQKDLDWIRAHVPKDVTVEDISDQIALIAVQGPRAANFLQQLTPIDLGEIPYYHFVVGDFAGLPNIVISRTGYTGEDGFELYADRSQAPGLWRTLLERGAPLGLKPVGLGARDTLRLEAGYMLYGNDIDQTTTPLEAGLGWTVKFDHDFAGREVLERQKAEGLPRRMVALEMLDRAIPRPHFPIYKDGRQVGELTSGTFSPTVNKGIALGYVEPATAKSGTEVEVEVRDQRHPAAIVRKPIYKRPEG